MNYGHCGFVDEPLCHKVCGHWNCRANVPHWRPLVRLPGKLSPLFLHRRLDPQQRLQTVRISGSETFLLVVTIGYLSSLMDHRLWSVLLSRLMRHEIWRTKVRINEFLISKISWKIIFGDLKIIKPGQNSQDFHVFLLSFRLGHLAFVNSFGALCSSRRTAISPRPSPRRPVEGLSWAVEIEAKES